VIEELIAGAGNERRELEGQSEKRNPADFALWKKASPEHIMRWPSPWSDGFPGWHIECSAMSSKYLGETFDIHGGGMDLLFPHHESEIAQSKGSCGKAPVKYWMHNNMITINGQKMGKSLGNFITLKQFFTGDHKLVEKAYSPMAIRFFILQAHYRSTLDFSNEGLLAAEKAFQRIINAIDTLEKLNLSAISTSSVSELEQKCFDAMNDDLNTAIVLSHLFEAVRIINSANAGTESLTVTDIDKLKSLMNLFVFDILGLKREEKISDDDTDGLMKLLLSIRAQAKSNKDFATSDQIRDELIKLNFTIKDGKDGSTWSKN
jgi:cysteinyl-tRNA synthetase